MVRMQLFDANYRLALAIIEKPLSVLKWKER